MCASVRVQSMRISLVVLTYNRADLLSRTMAHNLSCAGRPPDELVWVDNGSQDGVRDVMRSYAPDVCVLNKTNTGMFRGYNAGFLASTGDYVTITDDDMLMPDAWLDLYRSYLANIHNTGVICTLWNSPRLVTPRLVRMNDREYHPCYPIGRFIVSRDLLLKKIGLYREDFGLIGPGDLEWSRRAARVCKELGLLTYAVPHVRSIHLGTEAYDGPTYFAYKHREASDPLKRELLERCHAANYPYYNPYGR